MLQQAAFKLCIQFTQLGVHFLKLSLPPDRSPHQGPACLLLLSELRQVQLPSVLATTHLKSTGLHASGVTGLSAPGLSPEPSGRSDSLQEVGRLLLEGEGSTGRAGRPHGKQAAAATCCDCIWFIPYRFTRRKLGPSIMLLRDGGAYRGSGGD